MSFEVKKYLRLGLAVALGLALAALVGKYLLIPGDAPVEMLGQAVVANGQPELGRPVVFTASVRCPWRRRPTSAEFAPPPGMEGGQRMRSRLRSIRWGEWVWEVAVVGLPYRVGEIPSGTITVNLNPPPVPTAERRIVIETPPVDVAPLVVDETEAPALASAIDIQPGWGEGEWGMAAAIAAAAIAAVCLAIWLLARHKSRRAMPPPPWTEALARIRALRDDLAKGKLAAELCVAKLTDVVRGYLEKRFGLRAARQTTAEFLSELDRPASPLETGHRRFLGEFLAAADLVKFAGAKADGKLVEDTIARATQLVEGTIPSASGAGQAKK